MDRRPLVWLGSHPYYAVVNLMNVKTKKGSGKGRCDHLEDSVKRPTSRVHVSTTVYVSRAIYVCHGSNATTR
jgi:hypothetical protein